MKFTILYDNLIKNKDLISKWGFSCLIEGENIPTLLFDTGGEADILIENMEKLKLTGKNIDMVFISHAHWDHAGGLQEILNLYKVTAYLPVSAFLLQEKKPPFYNQLLSAAKVKVLKKPADISPGIHTTGEINKTEQSLILETDRGLVVVVGCSHPGVKNILEVASQFGKIQALIGGLHGFKEYDVLEELDLVCPTHCTQNIEEIKERYPEKYITGGAGKVIII